jgi:hypothetical protein
VWGSGVRVPSAPPVFLGVIAARADTRSCLAPNLAPERVYGRRVPSTDKTKKRSTWGRGGIRKHRAAYEVRVPAGTDPVTGERLRWHATARTEREAEKLRTKLLAEADAFRSARTNASLGYLLDRWLPQHDIDENTWESYESLIRIHIRPALGAVPLTVLVRKGTETVEQCYGDLRRCWALRFGPANGSTVDAGQHAQKRSTWAVQPKPLTGDRILSPRAHVPRRRATKA